MQRIVAAIACTALAAQVAAQEVAEPDPAVVPAAQIPPFDSAELTPGAVVVRVAGGALKGVEWVRFIPAGGEEERYLRYLQIAGLVPSYPWSLRGFSPAEARGLAAPLGTHPWSGGRSFATNGSRLHLLPLRAEIRHNSAFPYGSNDGAVWAGRGVTGSIEGGAAVSLGPVSLIAAPLAFRAQNAAFELFDGTRGESGSVADPLYGTGVDRPQRFGNGAYGRVDPGQSTARLDILGITAGISSANMIWGPMSEYPFVLGTNAPGFTHVFAGTAHPLNLWLAKFHGRIVWGRLEQSEYSPITGPDKSAASDEPATRRFAAGLNIMASPRGLPGLEIGLARFFHSFWPADGLQSPHFRKPLEGFLKRGRGEDEDNQLAAVYARWVFPAARTELYAEYGREDHNYDKRDLVQEPDHIRSYGLGVRHVLHIAPVTMSAIRAELINYQLPGIGRSGRTGAAVYTHGSVVQGHTHRGQLLGGGPAVGAGAGFVVAWDRYSGAGRTTIAFERIVRQERGAFYITGEEGRNASDVQYALTGERTRRMGAAEVLAEFTLIRGFNRDFRRDVWNTSLRLGARLPTPLQR